MTILEVTGVDGTGRDAYGELLKTVYGPMWQLACHSKIVIWSLIMQPKGRMGGKSLLSAVTYKLPQSAGVASLENFELPKSDKLKSFNPELGAKDLYMLLQWTGQVDRAAAGGDENAWAKPQAYGIQLARKQMMLNLARMAYLGYYQPLGKCSAAYDSTGGTGSSPNGSDFAGFLTLYGRNTRTSAAANFFNHGAHYIREGMGIHYTEANDVDDTNYDDHVNADQDQQITVVDIDDSDITAPKIYVDKDNGSSSFTDAAQYSYVHPFAHAQHVADTSHDTEYEVKESVFAGINGLSNLVTDSNLYPALYAQNRSAYSTVLDGQRHHDSGNPRAFSERYVEMAMDNASDNGTGEDPKFALCHRSSRREVVKELRNLRQFPVILTESGAARLTFRNGDAMVPYIVDRDCPPGIFWLLENSGFGWLTQSGMGPLASGSTRFVDKKDAYTIAMHMSGNGYTQNPYSNATVEDVSYSVGDLT